MLMCSHQQLLFVPNSDAEVRGTSKGSGMDELNLLVQLIGTAPTNKKEFRLNLFPSEEEEGSVSTASGGGLLVRENV